MVRIFTDFAVRDRMNQSSKDETTQLKAIRSLTAKQSEKITFGQSHRS